jgi:hypothetical protein
VKPLVVAVAVCRALIGGTIAELGASGDALHVLSQLQRSYTTSWDPDQVPDDQVFTTDCSQLCIGVAMNGR